MLSLKLVETYLKQAITPEDFKEKLINSMLTASPRERNYGIILKHHFSGESSYFEFADEMKQIIDEITGGIFPGAYAVYGREKSFISTYRKLDRSSEVTQMKDQYALRLVLSDDIIGIKDTVYFAFLILKGLLDHFQMSKGLILHPVTEKTDSKVPLAKDVRKELYIPKGLPIPLSEYEEFFKNYIMRPKKNGYQGLHFVVMSVGGLFIEIQIWTTSMARRNNNGSASHDTVYKIMDELDKACRERGPEFAKALLSPRIIGDVIMRNTAQENFPADII